ncbi:DUF565 domain-containing protein [Synechococcus sp. RSCCF101]|uniref:DUF565 domain-containing protein n=1 Tax=Synechococcus sp. RSCCF101 TaxID=2511069 RepID=UPI0012492DF6|nr:DUF565 domain-containing protein [Synechococcus sp. RSCCF101]QEY32242.1 DUF565 domain-containing protein [Synechococcus sp. RSCCF101]
MTNAQRTRIERSLGEAPLRFAAWSVNPWRRHSLQLVVLLSGFGVGTTLGTVGGALSVMDPVGAFVVVALLEVGVRLRPGLRREGRRLPLQLLDMARVGVLYGLLLEGFKLL